MGLRQSMPSSSIESCAPDSATVPCVACGHTNRPRSSRFEKRHSPSPLHQRILTRSPARPQNTNSCPEYGSSLSCVCTSADNPSNPLRISVAPAASHTCMPAGSAIIETTVLGSDPSASSDPRGLVCAIAVRRQTQPRSKHLASWLLAWPLRRVRSAAAWASTRSLEAMRAAWLLPLDQASLFIQSPPHRQQVSVHTVTKRDLRHRGTRHMRLLDHRALLRNRVMTSWTAAPSELVRHYHIRGSAHLVPKRARM